MKKDVFKKTTNVMLSLAMSAAVVPQFALNAFAASNGVDDFVTRCYEIALNRKPDEAGFDYWTSSLNNDEIGGATLVQSFIFSDEYTNLNKTNEAFVKDLYTMFMGRDADQSGFDYWCSELNRGKTKEEVTLGFSFSEEFTDLCGEYGISVYSEKKYSIDDFLNRGFKIINDAEIKASAFDMFKEGLVSGDVTAADFVNYVIHNAGTYSNEEYVKLLYNFMFERDASEDEKAYWVESLNNLICTKNTLLAIFVSSDEFFNVCANYGIECGILTVDESITLTADGFRIEIYNENGLIDSVDEYDANGNIIKETCYNENNQISSTFEFDINGNAVKETHYDTDGSVTNIIYNEYDSQNRLIRTDYTNPDVYGIKYVILEYNDAADRIKCTYFDANGSVVEEITYTASTFALVEIITYDGSGNSTKAIFEVYEYGSSELVSETTYDSNGNILSVTTYEDNSGDGFCDTITTCDVNGNIISKTISEYDENGNYIETTYDGNGNIISNTVYEYDEYGDFLSEITYDGEGNIISQN